MGTHRSSAARSIAILAVCHACVEHARLRAVWSIRGGSDKDAEELQMKIIDMEDVLGIQIEESKQDDVLTGLVQEDTSEEDMELFVTLVDEGLTHAEIRAYLSIRDKEVN